MLNEIFQIIAQETEQFLSGKGFSLKIQLGDPPVDIPTSGPALYIGMQEYGLDPIFKDHLPETSEPLSGNNNYAHLISLYFIPQDPAYARVLQLTEWVVAFFELRPFFQFSIGEKNYELAISMKSIPQNEYYQFWLSRKQAARPILFYQVRVSAQ